MNWGYVAGILDGEGSIMIKYHMKTYWRLQIASIPEVEYVLKNTLPFLIIKRDRAESAIKYCEYRIANSNRLKSITQPEPLNMAIAK